MLTNKKIILGITGSIAAYKAAMLTRNLIKEKAEVQVLMTAFAKEFITPLTLATLSKKPVLVDFYNPENGDWNNHVDLGNWADAMIIAPATANTIAKMASGVADSLLLTTYLSARCQVFVVPAMDMDMFNHPSTQKNIETLKSYGNIIFEPDVGELASGLHGKGRMAEPENIIKELQAFFSAQLSKKKIREKFRKKKILITAGPTFESIDPVRFIGNRSSGKMGYAIADELASQGCNVILISGPTALKPEHAGIKVINVVSANEMYEQCLKHFGHVDGAILTAAVADYKPKNVSLNKIKSKKSGLTIELKLTKDIAKELGQMKKEKQFLAGFALEDSNEIENAKNKIHEKNFDLIVLNSMNDEGAGIGYDTNKITIIERNNKITNFKLKNKKDVAKDIIDKIAGII